MAGGFMAGLNKKNFLEVHFTEIRKIFSFIMYEEKNGDNWKAK